MLETMLKALSNTTYVDQREYMSFDGLDFKNKTNETMEVKCDVVKPTRLPPAIANKLDEDCNYDTFIDRFKDYTERLAHQTGIKILDSKVEVREQASLKQRLRDRVAKVMNCLAKQVSIGSYSSSTDSWSVGSSNTRKYVALIMEKSLIVLDSAEVFASSMTASIRPGVVKTAFEPVALYKGKKQLKILKTIDVSDIMLD